jgi:predicted PurR-regulated permease PerM
MASRIVPVRSPFWWVRWVPAALVVLGILSFLVVAGTSVLVPLLVSFALAFMLEPLVDWFQRRRLSRNASVLLAMVTAVLAVILVLVFLLPSVWHQLQASVQKVPDAIRAASVRLHELVEYARERLGSDALNRAQAALQGLSEDPSQITDAIGAWLGRGVFGLVNLGSAAVGLAIVPFFVYYLLLDLNNIRDGLDRRIPEPYRPAGARLFDEIGAVVRGYVRGRFLVAAGMAVIYATGLLIFRVPLWAGIGVIAALIGIIPYLGVISGLLIALAFAVLDGAGPLRLLGVVGVFIVAQTIEDYVLTPRLIGDRLELHPMLVFIALIIAGDLFGLLGLVLAIPTLAVCKVVLRFIDELYLRSEFYTGRHALGHAPAGLVVREAVHATTSPLAQLADQAHAEAVRESPPRGPQSKPQRRRR